MPRPKNVFPTYKKHPRDSTARCWVDGRWVSLGAYNSPESKAEFERVCQRVRTGQPSPLATPARPAAPSVAEILLGFWKYAQEHYRRPDGTPTKEVTEYKSALRPVRELHGHTPAAEFGPVALRAVRQRMIDLGWCRTRVNKQVGRVRRVFKWAASHELVPVAVFAALETVGGLQRGRTGAKDTAAVGPADPAAVSATLPHLVPTLRAMVELQRWTGMRPGEARLLQPEDLHRDGDRWVYRPGAHKMAHLGRVREIPLGPKARAVLEPFLAAAPSPDAYVFTPANAREERFRARRALRKSKVPPSQMNQRKPYAECKKKFRHVFTDHGYAAFVRRACVKAGVGHWHPNQLRHLFATEVRRAYGLEAAQVVLGHAKADVTQVYAERDLKLAEKVAAEIG